jgi:hypothetical protein
MSTESSLSASPMPGLSGDSAPGFLMTPTLERNLASMARASGSTARLLMATTGRDDIEFITTDEEGLLTAAAADGFGGPVRLLASRRRPLEEGRRLAETIDIKAAAGLVVLGFGAGYHVRALAERMRRTGVIYVFEPDAGLLRRVLERIDHSDWIRESNVVFLTDVSDTAAIAAATRGVEGLLALGVQFLEHPSSRVRLGDRGRVFSERFTSVMRAVRTTVVTTLVQSEVTVRNLLMNLDRYATCAGIADLAGRGLGKPAIVVSAGPSLRRNIDLLRRPGARDRFIIIAVQTVLKQLLARGIRPHFVTALDYHEISRRFYEGITPEQVDGVTLVAEAKANPAILEAFPGDVRLIGDHFLDQLLGEGLAPPLGTIRPGATVAHLAYYLARHLGCDPVILVGQDLGFTDGQYYSAGAAIHGVWAGELSQFNTLEMMEWQRIMRGRQHLHREHDVLGRPIYTDEQMASYRVQFERDFGADAQLGLRVIDATEGGVAKLHTLPMTLREALETFQPPTPPRLPGARPAPDPDARLAEVERRVRSIGQDTRTVMEQSRRALGLLEQMLAQHSDQKLVNRLIAEVDAVREHVEALEPAFGLVNFLNQTGTLKRVRADRDIDLEGALTPVERQKRQIERDIVNVRWLGDAAERLGELLDESIRALGGGVKCTGDLIPREDAQEIDIAAGGARVIRGAVKVAAMIPLDFDLGGLGTARSIEDPFLLGQSPLRLTLLRLARCRQLDAVVVLTEDVDRAARAAGSLPATGPSIEFVRADLSPLRARQRSLRGARLYTKACWRGGLGGLSAYDEVCAAPVMAGAMERGGFDAAAVLGPDWSLIDPELTDAVVERYRRRPTGKGAHRLTFTQTPPGLAPCIVERSLMADMASRAQSAGVFATIGAMLAYLPVAPAADPIAQVNCVGIEPTVRDAQFRFIADSEPRRAAMMRMYSAVGEAVLAMNAAELAAGLAPLQLAPPEGPPQELVIELCTGRRTSGARCRWNSASVDPIERRTMPLGLADRILTEFGRLRTDGAITLAGAGDPLLHPDVLRVVERARKAGVAGVHIRTDLLCEREQVDALLDSGVDVISVDLMAESGPAYRAVMGVDFFRRVRGNLEHLLMRRAARATAGGLPPTWVVPRMTRCDAVYEELESFYDRWILAAGCAVIDPLPAAAPGDRIEPLPLPRSAARRMARERMTILSDGRVPAAEGDLSGERCIGDVGRSGVLPVWRELCSRRFDAPIESSPAPDVRVPARVQEESLVRDA